MSQKHFGNALRTFFFSFVYTFVLFSPQPVPDEVPEVSSEDTADDLKEPEFAPFPEVSEYLNLPLCHQPKKVTWNSVVTFQTYFRKYLFVLVPFCSVKHG